MTPVTVAILVLLGVLVILSIATLALGLVQISARADERMADMDFDQHADEALELALPDGWAVDPLPDNVVLFERKGNKLTNVEPVTFNLSTPRSLR